MTTQNKENTMFTQSTKQSAKINLIDTILDSGMITMCADNLIVLAQRENCNSALATVVAYDMEAQSGYDHQWDQEDIIDLINSKK